MKTKIIIEPHPLFPGRMIESCVQQMIGVEAKLISMSGFSSVLISMQKEDSYIIKMCLGYYTLTWLLNHSSEYYYGLKFYKNLGSEDIEKAKRAFAFEVETLLSLPSKVCPQIRTFDLDNAVPYFISDRVDGPTLSELLKVNLREDLRIKLVAELASAVTVINKCGIIHTDITPDNIMLDRSGQNASIVVIDFNNACRIGDIIGKRPVFHYYAPWLTTEKSFASSDVDVYGWLVVAHEIMTGVVPSFFYATTTPDSRMNSTALKSLAHKYSAAIHKRLVKNDYFGLSCNQVWESISNEVASNRDHFVGDAVNL